jgi:hypothetical protein
MVFIVERHAGLTVLLEMPAEVCPRQPHESR